MLMSTDLLSTSCLTHPHNLGTQVQIVQPIRTITMRTGLLLLRSCVGWGHRGSYVSACNIHHRQHSSLSLFVPLASSHQSDLSRPPSLAQHNAFRPLSSSKASSFEAPEPPSSLGQPVFPDIQFHSQSSSGEVTAASQRNADKDAVFVVNGSSRGIGLQFVKSLVERTKGKVIACCRTPSKANALKEIASKYPERIEILPLDVEDQSSIDTLASNIAQNYQRVDGLFNVAGILGDGGKTTSGPERSIANIERDWMEKTLAVNVIGPTMLTKALSPLMRTSGRRSVKMSVDGGATIDIALPTDRPPTVIANLSARVGSISDNQLGGWYTYRVSKAALNQATRTMGLELQRQGTWIVALHPGTTDTDLSKPFQRNVREGRLFPVEFTVGRLMDVVESMGKENTGGFYDWAGKALPF